MIRWHKRYILLLAYFINKLILSEADYTMTFNDYMLYFLYGIYGLLGESYLERD